jgi:transcriptional regulator with XRE-family HTH domain
MPLKEKFGEIICKKRVEMGLTYRQISGMVDIHPYNLSAIDNGNTKKFSLHHLRLYLDALNMKLSDVFDNTEIKEATNA